MPVKPNVHIAKLSPDVQPIIKQLEQLIKNCEYEQFCKIVAVVDLIVIDRSKLELMKPHLTN